MCVLMNRDYCILRRFNLSKIANTVFAPILSDVFSVIKSFSDAVLPWFCAGHSPVILRFGQNPIIVSLDAQYAVPIRPGF